MNSLLLRPCAVPKTSLRAFAEYRELETQFKQQQSSVNPEGVILEYETLELRVHPPNVVINNEELPDATLIAVDSANRPGTLVEVLQLLTELGLNVVKARISSDGGWFVDEFHVTDAGTKVTNERKLRAIKKVLSVEHDAASGEGDAPAGGAAAAAAGLPHLHAAADPYDDSKQCSTVFELAGTDRIGLLADVIELLKNNGCLVRSAAVWTCRSRAAFVVSVLEQATAAGPIRDSLKMARLRQLLQRMMDPAGNCIVNCHLTTGLIHYERRLHQLLLQEEEAEWKRSGLAEQYQQEMLIASAAARQAIKPLSADGTANGGTAAKPPASDSTHTANGTAAPAGQPARAAAAKTGAAPYANGNNPTGSAAGCGSLSLAPPCSGPIASSALEQLGCGPCPGHSAPGASSAACASGAWGSASDVTPSSSMVVQLSSDGSCGGSLPSTLGSPEQGAANPGARPAAVSGPSSPRSTLGGEPCSDGYVSSSSAPGPGGCSREDSGGGGGDAAEAPSAACASTTFTASSTSRSTSPQAAALLGTAAAAAGPTPQPATAAASAHKPHVSVQYDRHRNYWAVNVRCRDRQKLLFDTVCTLADLKYDVYHGAVDCEVERSGAGGAPVSWATQTFYVRPRFGDYSWDPARAAKLKYILEAAIQRRQPQGCKVHIQTFAEGGGQSDLPALTAVWREFGLCITRAKVRALGGAPGEHTFYLTDAHGRPPADKLIQDACEQIGGVRLARADVSASYKSALARVNHRFGFIVTARAPAAAAAGAWAAGLAPGVSPVGSYVGSV